MIGATTPDEHAPRSPDRKNTWSRPPCRLHNVGYVACMCVATAVKCPRAQRLRFAGPCTENRGAASKSAACGSNVRVVLSERSFAKK
eukprot:6192037-Pleurochrysis_carterae.AAC.3